MIGDLGLAQLADLIYNAVDNPDVWTTFLARLSDALGAQAAALFTQDSSSWAIPYVIGVQCFFSAAANPDKARTGRVGVPREKHRPENRPTSPDLADPAVDMRDSEFFHDWLSVRSFHHALEDVVAADGDLVSKIVVMRRRSMGEFSSDDEDLFHAVVPTLRRAIQLQNRVIGLSLWKTTMERVIDGLPAGILVVDDRCRILFGNRAADRMIAENDGIGVIDGAVRALRSGDDASLRAAISATAHAGRFPQENLGAAIVTIARPSGKRPFAVTVLPASECQLPYRPAAANPTAILSITDSEEVPEPHRRMLQTVYGLTPREADLATALMSGLRLGEAADRLHISQETARVHLRSVFAKTCTHNQAQLISLLLRGASTMIGHDEHAALPRRRGPRRDPKTVK